MKRILVVDDDREICEIVTVALNCSGFEVAAAGSGAQLQSLLGERLPDLILLDIVMPGQDGYQLVSRLRADSVTRHIPVMIMTAHAEEIYARISRDLGVYHITKPFHPLELVERVRVVLD